MSLHLKYSSNFLDYDYSSYSPQLFRFKVDSSSFFPNITLVKVKMDVLWKLFFQDALISGISSWRIECRRVLHIALDDQSPFYL